MLYYYGRVKRESHDKDNREEMTTRRCCVVARYDIGRIRAITELERKVSPTKTLIVYIHGELCLVGERKF